MKKIFTFLVFVLSVMSVAEGAANYPYSESSPCDIMSVSYPLRTIILYPATGENGAISADLIIEDGEYKLLYNGKSYTFRSISDSRYDSTVIIDGQEYFFRVKPRSYE